MTDQATGQFRHQVLPRLRALGRRLRLYALLDGLSVLCPAVLAAMFITLLVDRAFRLDWDMRLTQLATLLLALAAVAWRWVWTPLRVPVSDVELALLVERRFPELSSRLVSAVEFAGAGAAASSARRSEALMSAVIAEAQVQARGLRFQNALAHARACRRGAVTLGCIALVATAALAAGDVMSLWFQRNVLLRNLDWPQRNKLVVRDLKDGRLVVARDDDVTVTADVVEGYEPPRQAFIAYRGESGVAERVQMPAVLSQADGSGARQAVGFTHTFNRIEETLRCRVEGGDARSDWFLIEVVDRPRIDEVGIAILPPAYTRMARYELRAGQTVAEALKGSRLTFHIRTNKPVTRAVLIRDTTGDPQELGPARRVGEREFTAEDAPPGTAAYYFEMEDELGFGSVSERSPPLRLSVRLLADKPPTVKMRVRGAGEMITPEAVLPVEMDFADPYGLASAGLVHDLGKPGSSAKEEPIEGFEPGTKTFTRTVEWAAGRHGAAEGDRLTLYAQAKDFDDVSGPNAGESAKVTLRVVSREELLAELNRREQEYRQDFERLLRHQEELYSELLSLFRSVGAAEPSRDRLRSLGLLARRQRDHAGRLNTIRVQFEQVMSELQVNQLSSPAVEARLGGAIIAPMGALQRNRLPAAADGIDGLARNASDEAIQSVKTSQDAILADMNRILAAMQKWEGYQEAVARLREVLNMQGNLNQEVERQLEEEIFGGPPGTRPATRPSQ
ncbi:MAG: hypothetical protein AMXMBFR83_07360 [Phycisphaerae bacterium]